MTSYQRFVFFFVILLALILSACGSAPPAGTTTTAAGVPAPAPVPGVPAPAPVPGVPAPAPVPGVPAPAPVPGVPTTIIGSVGDGPVIGGNITVADANGVAVNVGAVVSGANGQYQLTVPVGTAFPLTITSQGGNDQTLVAVGAASTVAGSFVTTVQQGDVYANISPLSTMVTAVAKQLGGITAANMATAYQNVIKELGIGLNGQVWPATTRTSELNFNPNLLTASQYAALVQANEAIGEIVARTARVNPTVTLASIINVIALDLADGVLNGSNNNVVTAFPGVTTDALQIRNNVFRDLKNNGFVKLGATAINGDGYTSIATQNDLVQASANVGRTISVVTDLQNATIVNAVNTAQALANSTSVQAVNLFFASSVATNPIGDGTENYTVTVNVLNNQGGVSPNQLVKLTYPVNLVNGIVRIVSTTNPTDTTGTAIFKVTDLVSVPDTVSITATVGAVSSVAKNLLFSPCVGACGNAGGGALQITPNVNNMPADGSVVQVTVNTTAGQVITLANTQGAISSATITPVNGGVADAQGVALFHISNTVAETISLTATDPSLLTATLNYTFVPAVGQILVTAAPATVPADGQTASTVTVTLKTLAGQGVANEPVAIFSSGSALAQATATTNVFGTVSFSITDAAAETVIVTVKTRNGGTLPGTMQTGTTNVIFNDIIADLLFNSSSSNLAADNTTTATLTATAVNAAQQPLSGRTVVFTTTTGVLTNLNGTALSFGKVQTDISGKAQVLLKSNTPTPIGAPASVSATSGGVTKALPVDFTKVIDITKSTISVSPVGSISANGTSAGVVQVKLLDVLGAGIEGKTVVFTDPYGSSSIFSKSFAVTDPTGIALMSVTDIAEEVVDVYAYVDNFILPVSIPFQAPVTKVTLTTSLSSVPATDPVGAVITAKALDARGVGLANRSLTFSATGNGQGTAALTVIQGTTNASGVLTTVVTNQFKELVTMNAFSANGIAAPTVNVNFTAPVASMTLTVQPAGGSVPADGKSSATIVVNVKDAGGNPIVNQSVVFSDYTTILTGNPSSAQLSASNVVTDVTGTAQMTVANPVAGSVTIKASAGGQILTGVVNFALTNLQVLVTTPGVPFVASGVPYDVYILVNDQNGVAQPGQTLTLTTDSATSILFPTTVTTDANGLAVPTLKNSVAETMNLNIADATGGTALAVPITFISNDASSVTLTAQPFSVAPDGVSSFTMIATVKSLANTVVPNALVSFSTIDPYAVLSRSEALTDANGRAQIQVYSQFPTVAPVTASLLFNPAAVVQNSTTNIIFEETVTSVQIAIVGSNTVPVDSYVNIQATVFSGANPIPNRTVSFRSSGSGLFTNNALVTTDSKGVATIKVLSAVAETLSVIATASGLDSLNQAVVFTPKVSNFQMSISPASASVAADNASQVTVIVSVKDVNGVAIKGQLVNFRDVYGSAAQLSAASVVTDLSGTAVITVVNAQPGTTTVEAVAGLKKTAALINFVSPNGLILQIEAVNPSGPIDPVNLTNPANGIFPAGATKYRIKVSVKDSKGVALAQQSLSLRSNSATMKFNKLLGIELPILQLTTDVYGEAVAEIANTVAEQVTLSLVGPANLTSTTQSIQFISEKAQTVSIIANPSSLRNDGTPADLIINVLDATGAAVPNAFIKLSKDALSSALLVSSVLYTDAQGSVITKVSSQVENTATITASLPLNPGPTGAIPSASAAVSFGPAVTDLLFNATPLSTEASNQVSFITLSATVLDNGRPLQNRPVTFTTTGSAILDNLSNKKVTVNTNLQGVATLPNVSNPTPETVTVTASIDQFVQSLDVTFTPVVASMTVTPFPSAAAIADGSTPISLIVTVKDAVGSPIQGQEVFFADKTLNGSSAQLSQASAITNASGTAQIDVISPTAGGVDIQVSAGSTFIPIITPLNFSQVQTLQIKVLSATNPVMTNAISDNFGTIQILAQGINGLPLSGQSLVLGKNSGTLVFSQNPISSDLNGIATVQIRNSVPENVDITITDNAGTLLTTIPTQFVADRAQAITMAITPNSVLPDGLATATINATVRDQVGAAVPNAYVEFTTINNGAVDPYAVISIPSAMTDALGQVTATVRRTQPGIVNITTSLPSNILLFNNLTNAGLGTLTPQQVDYIAGFKGSVTQAINFEEPVSSITLETDINNISADGNTQATVTATIRSPSGQLLSGRPVVFTSAPAALTASQVNTGTGIVTGFGIATTQVSHNVAELITVSATSGGITQTLDINFTPVVSSVRLSKDPTQSGMKANGLDIYNITAQALDPYGVGIANAVITFKAIGTGISAITPSTGSTDAAGILVATVSDLYSGGEVVSVTAEASQKISTPLGLAFDPTSSASAVASLSVAASQFSILTDNSDSAIVRATILDLNNAIVPGVVVTFSSDGGQLSAGSAVTDLKGVAQVNLSSGTSNQANRIITITANVFSSSGGVFSSSTSVLTTGTTLTLNSSTTGLDSGGAPAPLIVKLTNAGGQPIAASPVNLSYVSLNTVAPFSGASFGVPIGAATFAGITDVAGQFAVDVYGTAVGSLNVVAAGAGATSALIFNISNLGGSFAITSPIIDPYSLSTNVPLSITVRSPNASPVTLATSFGVFSNGLSVIDILAPATFPGAGFPLGVWNAVTQLTASQAGMATIQAFDRTDPTVSDSMTVAVSAPAANATSISLQSNIGVIAPNIGAGGDIATLTATVRDSYGQPVGNAEVIFEILNPTGGGEIVSPAIGITNSSGNIVTTFTSGVQSSGATGVNIKASVVQAGIPSTVITSQSNIVIGGTAASVVIGTGSQITELSVTEYQLPMSVMVADSNGNPVTNSQVTLSVWPAKYSTGAWTLDNVTGNFFANVTNTLANEDVNENLIIDPGEDLNADGTLTPPSTSSGTVPAIVFTDANGVANFNLIYQKQSAEWIVARIRASILAQGSEAAGQLTFRLPHLVADEGSLPDSPFSEAVGNISIVPTAQMLPVGSSSVVAIQVRDTRGVVVANAPVTVSVSGSATVDTYAVPTVYTTDSNGNVSVVVADTVAENVIVTVTKSGQSQSTIMYFGAEIRLFSQSNVVLADGVDAHKITVQALDSTGNSISSMPISFNNVSAGIINIVADVTVVTNPAGELITDNTGVVRAQVTDLFNLGETVSLTALSGQIASNPALSLPFTAITGVPTIPTQLAITANKFAVKTGGVDTSLITVTVQDDQYAVIANTTVSFTTTGGLLTANSSVTDTYGRAFVSYTAGTSNFNNRTEVITAQAAGNSTLKASIPIVVDGSTISAISQQATLTIGGGVTDILTVKVQDSLGTALYNEPINFTSTPELGLSALSGLTDVQGQLSVNVTGLTLGTGTVTATGLNAAVVQTYQVASLGNSFGITSPAVDPYSMSITDPFVTIEVYAPVGINTIAFSASVGDWTTGTLPGYVEVAVAVDRYARADLYSSTSGVDVVQVFDIQNQAIKDTTKIIWSAPVNAATQVQLKTSSSSLLPSVVGGIQNQAQITATVLDVNNQPVSGVGVTFAIQNGTNSGEVLSNVFSSTNTAGTASTTFTSGTSSSGNNGVSIVATVVSTTLAVVPLQAVNIIIAGTAGSVAIGLATDSISSPTPATYSVPFTVLVTDSAGAAVAGAVVTLDLWPEVYMRGSWLSVLQASGVGLCTFAYYGVNYSSGPLAGNVCNPAGLPKTFYTLGIDAYANEDVNRNLILDLNPLEDLNGDGFLTPGIATAGSIPLSVTTGVNGLATFDLIYLKTYAPWIEDRLTATTLVSGTETRSSLLFTLPVPNAAIIIEGSPPSVSPFGL